MPVREFVEHLAGIVDCFELEASVDELSDYETVALQAVDDYLVLDLGEMDLAS